MGEGEGIGGGESMVRREGVDHLHESSFVFGVLTVPFVRLEHQQISICSTHNVGSFLHPPGTKTSIIIRLRRLRKRIPMGMNVGEPFREVPLETRWGRSWWKGWSAVQRNQRGARR